MRRIAVLVLVVAVVAAFPKLLDSTDPISDVGGVLGLGAAERSKATVLRVRDGDTIRVRIDKTGVEEEVRILGIDTPEVRENAECGGDVATTSMHALTPVGSTVVLTSDPSQGDRDRYDRLLRYVGRSGHDVGLKQVQAGLAKIFVFEDDPFDRVDAYRRVQRKARNSDLGLWAACWQ
jgi:endonuclease YncB( thermonuclease family)